MRGGVPGYVRGQQRPQPSVLCGELDDAYALVAGHTGAAGGGPPKTSTMH